MSAAASGTILLDTTPPIASVTSPSAGRELRGVVTVSTTFSDPLVNTDPSGQRFAAEDGASARQQVQAARRAARSAWRRSSSSLRAA
ncbi:MAG: hypothetical protein ACHQ4H_00770 [Ktedonobacterales bacterium]